MFVLGRSAGGENDDPGWWGECCGRGCSRSDVSLLPEGTTIYIQQLLIRLPSGSRAHKNGRLEQERVTSIEAHSQGKISRQY